MLVNVAAGASITVTFSEPIQPSTVTTSGMPNVRLLQGATPVELDLPVFANGNRTVTLQPKQPLTSSTRYTLTIIGAPDGPQDEAGLPLPDAFVSTFTVQDLIPPVVTSLSPASEVQQVLPDAAIRVVFSEPIVSATITLRDVHGASVPGQAALTLGNTVAVFVPQDFLAANTSYTFTVSNVVDTAGNPLAGGPLTSRFFTLDTLAPVISALQLTGAQRGRRHGDTAARDRRRRHQPRRLRHRRLHRAKRLRGAVHDRCRVTAGASSLSSAPPPST
jgi:hypothetical protein